jgi:hypothetical protein
MTTDPPIHQSRKRDIGNYCLEGFGMHSCGLDIALAHQGVSGIIDAFTVNTSRQ